MKRATPVAVVSQAVNSRCASAIKVSGIAKILGVGAQRGFPKIPIPGAVVVGVSGFIDMRIVLELPDDISVAASALPLRDSAIFEMDLHARPKATRAVCARNHSVGHGIG